MLHYTYRYWILKNTFEFNAYLFEIKNYSCISRYSSFPSTYLYQQNFKYKRCLVIGTIQQYRASNCSYVFAVLIFSYPKLWSYSCAVWYVIVVLISSLLHPQGVLLCLDFGQNFVKDLFAFSIKLIMLLSGKIKKKIYIQ